MDVSVSYFEFSNRNHKQAPNNVFEHFANTSKGNAKPIEFYGEMKIRQRQQIHVLEKVTMRGDRVSFAGDAIREEAAHLREVDLQGNLLHSWEEVRRMS